MTRRDGPSTLYGVGWISMLAIGVLMVAAGLFIVSEPVSADDFEEATGVVWEDFESSDAAVADYLVREARLLGVAFTVLGIVAVAVAWSLLRKGSRTGWRIAWFVPVVFAGSAAVFYSADAGLLGGFYAGATVVAAVVVLVGASNAWD